MVSLNFPKTKFREVDKSNFHKPFSLKLGHFATLIFNCLLSKIFLQDDTFGSTCSCRTPVQFGKVQKIMNCRISKASLSVVVVILCATNGIRLGNDYMKQYGSSRSFNDMDEMMEVTTTAINDTDEMMEVTTAINDKDEIEIPTVIVIGTQKGVS